MAKVLISDLDAATTPLTGAEKVELEQDGVSVQATTQDIADLAGGGGGASYLAYVALLTQADTDAPVATILNSADSNYLGDIVWGRNGVGEYLGTLAGAFAIDKTVLFAGSAGDALLALQVSDSDTISMITKFSGMSPSDGLLYNTSIEIRVYP